MSETETPKPEETIDPPIPVTVHETPPITEKPITEAEHATWTKAEKLELQETLKTLREQKTKPLPTQPELPSKISEPVLPDPEPIKTEVKGKNPVVNPASKQSPKKAEPEQVTKKPRVRLI